MRLHEANTNSTTTDNSQCQWAVYTVLESSRFYFFLDKILQYRLYEFIIGIHYYFY